ncbi:predicted protein [Nematostella vectensis]|uniref:SS18 N-terminal domain-containing protein n=1 Tax=Nematostella vectensis TaxID=45351 RepID=A7SAM5_NEMVE|nr:calcium-responsive transactivator [Nematostella vectensis]EDO39218.1 predicted protein [Nematostella vectensis]|eukprot:XP_001631281.1 predicted protein [Nematostella vectensis]
MSVAFTSARRPEPSSQSVQELLDENTQLIQAIVDYQNKGKAYESTQYQQLLHRNLVYLATLADSNQTGQPSQGTGSSGQKPLGLGPTSSVGLMHPQGLSSGVGNVMGDRGPTSVGQSSMLQPSTNEMPQTPMSTAGAPYPGMSPTPVSSYGQATPPPQLQHPSGPNPGLGSAAGYPQSSGGQIRGAGQPVMGGPIGGLPQQQQAGMPRHPPQMKQQPAHMMGGSQQASQQYIMQQQQQRQMQYRQTNAQQVPQQQQMAANPNNYSSQSGASMMQGYTQPQQQQQQSQRYMYRQATPQQPLSHMPYPQQQSNPMRMGGQAMNMGQMGMGGAPPSVGQQTMGPSLMAGQSQMGPSPMGGMGQSPIASSPMGPSSMVQSPMGSTHSPMQSPMGQPPV